MGNTPYVVIVNEKSDEGQKVLEALEENIEKMDIGSHRELVIFFFRMAEPSAERSQKREKNIRELAKIMHRSLFFGQKHNSNEEMKPDSIETEIFKILRILKSMKKAEDKDLIINLLDDISLFLDENV
ncbi:hypothetical protein NXX78_23485 [Bacteroides fragilis]|nr:hypothetical protein [Bacteroides fragilis]